MIEEEVEVKSFKDKLADLWFNISYYLFRKPCEAYWNVKNYFINLHRFRRELWEFRSFDYTYPVMMFRRSLELLRDCIVFGNEELLSRSKKVAAINELLDLLVEHEPDEFKDTEEYDKALTKQYNRIARILRGQTNEEIQKKYDKELALVKKKTKDKKKLEALEREGWYEVWAKVFDGTGLTGWWD